jgi:hypothetical protein
VKRKVKGRNVEKREWNGREGGRNESSVKRTVEKEWRKG